MCEPEPDFQCPGCGTALKNTYHCPKCDADVRELDSGVDVTEDKLREELSGESMIHRLREWSDGDTVYAVTQFTEKDRGATGKTFREDAKEKAREFYETGFPPEHVTISVLFRATVKDPITEPQDPVDPGEPPLKFAKFTDVEILDWTDHTGDSDTESEGETIGEVHLHTKIGNRDGVILELRPSHHDHPSERDMSHLSDEKARELRDHLDDYLGESDE